jgi:hypothetical protein
MGCFAPCLQVSFKYYDVVAVNFSDAKHISKKSCDIDISRSPRAPVLAVCCHAGVVLDGWDYTQGQLL